MSPLVTAILTCSFLIGIVVYALAYNFYETKFFLPFLKSIVHKRNPNITMVRSGFATNRAFWLLRGTNVDLDLQIVFYSIQIFSITVGFLLFIATYFIFAVALTLILQIFFNLINEYRII